MSSGPAHCDACGRTWPENRWTLHDGAVYIWCVKCVQQLDLWDEDDLDRSLGETVAKPTLRHIGNLMAEFGYDNIKGRREEDLRQEILPFEEVQ